MAKLRALTQTERDGIMTVLVLARTDKWHIQLRADLCRDCRGPLVGWTAGLPWSSICMHCSYRRQLPGVHPQFNLAWQMLHDLHLDRDAP